MLIPLLVGSRDLSLRRHTNRCRCLFVRREFAQTAVRSRDVLPAVAEHHENRDAAEDSLCSFPPRVRAVCGGESLFVGDRGLRFFFRNDLP